MCHAIVAVQGYTKLSSRSAKHSSVSMMMWIRNCPIICCLDFPGAPIAYLNSKHLSINLSTRSCTCDRFVSLVFLYVSLNSTTVLHPKMQLLPPARILSLERSEQSLRGTNNIGIHRKSFIEHHFHEQMHSCSWMSSKGTWKLAILSMSLLKKSSQYVNRSDVCNSEKRESE